MAAKAVVLLSGGMDSAVVLAWMQREGYECIALSFDYGQRHRVELDRARHVAAAARVTEHVIEAIDLRAFGASALTADIPVPHRRESDPPAPTGEIPVTYVPARNLLFLSCGLALAEARGARHIAIGVNAIDYSGYPDCRPAFIRAFEAAANLATKAGVESLGEPWFRVHTPLLELSKAEIVRLGRSLGVDFDATISCYDPSSAGSPCGECDACRLRALGFAQAGA
jgi:7-cyano-7-deazaguanine synthase